MPTALIPAFLFYSYVNGITPGPANICSLSAAIRYGRKQALKQWRGLWTGFLCDAMIAVLICYFLGAAMGEYVAYLKYVGAAYIVYLAIKILRSGGVPEEEAEEDAQKNCNFFTGLIVQLTNVKVILFCITALSTYVLPYSQSFISLLAVGLFLPFTGPICNLAWLFAGDALRNLFKNHRRAVNIVMALSLIACAANILIH